MKILIDPIYTGRPSTCSTSYLAWDVIEHFIAKRPDVFFYLLAPEGMEQVDIDFVSRRPDRVTVMTCPALVRDRVSEVFRIPERLLSYLAPGVSPIWDFDAVLSSRIPMLPFLRNSAGRETNFEHGTPRLFLGIDEMPMFSFSDSVAWSTSGHMDLPSLAAYMAGHGVLLSNLWAKPAIMRAARKQLAPSNVIELERQIHECLPVKLKRLFLKVTPVDQTLRVAFCGRMTGTRNFEDVADLFRKQFAFPLNRNGVKVEFVISTNSLSTGSLNVGDLSFVDIQKNDRAKFHALLPSLHVAVNLSHVEDFSLSTYEPLLHGVPVIVLDRPWAAFLGPDYPFRVTNEAQGYAVISEFAKNYDAMYSKFAAWEATTWKAFVEGKGNVTTAETAWKLVVAHEAALMERLSKTDAYQSFRDVAAACQGEEAEPLKVGREMGMFKVFPNPNSVPVGKRPAQYFLKPFMQLAGWRDTNAPGVFRR